MDTSGNIRELMTPEEREEFEKQFKAEFEKDSNLKRLQEKIESLKDATTPRDDEIPIDKLPNPDCKDCYGRGHITRILENIRKVEPCHCVKDKP